MLVLTRKSEEKIVIDEDIEIIVLKVQKGMVSLGIKAPKEKKIHRAELLAVEAENTEGAVQAKSIDLKGVAQKIKLKPKK